MEVSIDDLIIAYRKAKVDAYYENGHIMARAFAKYEMNLVANLKHLLGRIESNDLDWFSTETYTGHYALVLKDYEENYDEDKNAGDIFFSSGMERWKTVLSGDPGFRVIGNTSVDFHVICSLWIDKVGYAFESNLLPSTYGCRLKRPKSNSTNETSDSSGNYYLETLEHGHFGSYYHAYKQWQRDGFDAIQNAIGNNKKVVAITADIKRFYHGINPEFLLNSSFYNFLGLEESYLADNALTRLLVHSFSSWSKNSTKQLVANYGEDVVEAVNIQSGCGVPIGISASKVVANLVLYFLDKMIEQELVPTYYGRYVDDIFLVLEDKGKFKSKEDFWIWISGKIAEITRGEDDSSYRLSIPYAANSEVKFNLGKFKLFVLSDSSGESFINALRDNLEKNSSEWRMLPDVDENLESLTDDLSIAYNNGGNKASSLRQMDEISVQRLALALRLKHFENLVEILPREIIQKPIIDFIKLVHDFIIIPDKTIVYVKYFPRFLKLLIRAGNAKLALETYNRIRFCWRELAAKASGNKQLVTECGNYCDLLLQEALITSLPLDLKVSDEIGELMSLLKLKEVDFKHEIWNLAIADLHSLPLKDFLLYLPEQIRGQIAEQPTPPSSGEMYDLYLRTLYVIFEKFFGDYQYKFLPGLFFATRPFRMIELTQLYGASAYSGEGFSEIKNYYYLFYPGNTESWEEFFPTKEEGKGSTVKIDFRGEKDDKNPVFALTSFLTKEESWESNVANRNLDPDGQRYIRLFRLVNRILLCKEIEVNYVVFPELSIPRRVLTYIALKLSAKNISLISGVEYETVVAINKLPPNVRALVSNQLVYFICSRFNSRRDVFFLKQEKILPAFKEETELYRIGGKLLYAANESKYILKHNNFFFSGLICNDLLDIDYRQQLRGDIDALIVVEWNQDVRTYDALVKSTSYDLHCFVVQVNNRKYGDTRLRAPYKQEFERDKVRVRGGELDYFVVSTLDIKALRKFQSDHRSNPDGPFKPVPTGFHIHEDRKAK